MGLGHLFRLFGSQLREAHKRLTRSPRWAALERTTIAARGQHGCEGCGTLKHLQVHHKKPFHLHPELELEPTNLVVACMNRNECHLRIGHGGDWRAWNPNVVRDLGRSLLQPSDRPRTWADARAARMT